MVGTRTQEERDKEEKVVNYDTGILYLLCALAILGAITTFPLIFIPLNPPRTPSRDSTARVLLGLSWLMFTIAVLLAILGASFVPALGLAKRYIQVQAEEAVDHGRMSVFQNLVKLADWLPWGETLTVHYCFIAAIVPIITALICMAVVAELYILGLGYAAIVIIAVLSFCVLLSVIEINALGMKGKDSQSAKSGAAVPMVQGGRDLENQGGGEGDIGGLKQQQGGPDIATGTSGVPLILAG
jgi:hypothetical protein